MISDGPTAIDPELLYAVANGTATLTLNRPKKFNPISSAMLGALESALDRAAADPAVRVVVLAASGPAFSAGHDLKEMMATRTPQFIGELFGHCSRVMMQIQNLPQPVIARVHGIATAAGCQLVAACDLAVASTEARFATSGINFGLFCATPGVPVSRNISRKRAFEMLFTGEFVDAQTALAWGLVNRVVPADRLDEEVGALAATLKEKPPAVCAAGKKVFYQQLESGLANAYQIAGAAITDNMLGDDAAEGVGAFIEKRKPAWRER